MWRDGMGVLTFMPTTRPRAAHILIVMHDFSTGGSERIAIRLANVWARSGRRVSILCGVMQGPARALVDPRVEVVGIWPQIERSALSRISLGNAMAACVNRLQPDIIFSPGNFHLPVVGVMARLLGDRRPPIVCKLSNPLRRPDRPSPFQHIFDAATRTLAAKVDAVVAMSSSLADEARAILAPIPVQRIYEPNIDIADYPAPRPIETSAKRLIVCAGRLVSQKNFALAIRAFAALDRSLDARLMIFGDGEKRIALEVLVDELGLNDRVEFAGHVRDIRPALARASLFLLSSRYEGYPAVLIEALAAGVPVVSTPCTPALSEIMIDASYGKVVAPDAGALAGAMDEILRAPRGQRVQAGELLERHRIDHVADEYLALFDRTIEARLTKAEAEPA